MDARESLRLPALVASPLLYIYLTGLLLGVPERIVQLSSPFNFRTSQAPSLHTPNPNLRSAVVSCYSSPQFLTTICLSVYSSQDLDISALMALCRESSVDGTQGFVLTRQTLYLNYTLALFQYYIDFYIICNLLCLSSLIG